MSKTMFDENSCRLCLSNNGQMEHINDQDISLKIYELTKIEIVHKTGMPSNICEFCKSKLVISIHFKNQCLETDQYLCNYFLENCNSKSNSKTEFELICLPQLQNTESDDQNNIIDKIDETKSLTVIKPEPKTDLNVKPRRSVRKRKLKKFFENKNQTKQEATVKDIVLKKKKEKVLKKLEKYPSVEIMNSEPEEAKTETISKEKELPNYNGEEDNNGFDSDENRIKVIEMKSNNQEDGSSKFKVFIDEKITYIAVCSVCGKLQQNLKQHMAIHTGEKKNKCPYCGKGFVQKGNLKHHINTHTGNKPYSCKLCDKSFAEPNSLRSHMVTHTGERKYGCEICGKTFGYSHTLSAHKRTHTQDRKHCCTFCNKLFLTRYGLKKHVRIHTGEKPYKCETCPKQFTSSGNLATHRRVHTKERPYECSVCSMTFSYRCVLNTHMKVHGLGKQKDTDVMDDEEFEIITKIKEKRVGGKID